MVVLGLLGGCSGGSDAGVEMLAAADSAPPAAASTVAAATTATSSDAPTGTATATAIDTMSSPTTTSRIDVPPVAATGRCDPVAGDAPGHVVIWHELSTAIAGLVAPLVDLFVAQRPDITVDFVDIEGDYPAVIDRLRDTPPDEQPDIVIANEETVRVLADSGRVVPVADCTGGQTPANFTDLLPIIRRTYSIDDVLWAAPFNVSVPVMYYDRKLWERAGLDPDRPPTDVDELEQTIVQLADSEAVGSGAVLYDKSGSWLLVDGAVQHQTPLVVPDNGFGGVQGLRADFHHDWAIDLVGRFQRLRQEGKVEWLGLNANGTDDLALLVHPTTPTGMTFNTSAALGQIIQLLEMGRLPDVEVGVAPLPFGGQGSAVGGGALWLLGDDPVQVGRAWQVVDWLTAPERIAELAAKTGYIPTTRRAADDPVTVAKWADEPEFRVAYDQAAATPDSIDATAMQVGNYLEVDRELELAVAWPIDDGNDIDTEFTLRESRVDEALAAYAAVTPDTGG